MKKNRNKTATTNLLHKSLRFPILIETEEEGISFVDLSTQEPPMLQLGEYVRSFYRFPKQ